MIYGRVVERGWPALLLAFLAAAASLGAFLPRFSVDAGTNVLLNEDDLDLAEYNISRPEWGYDEYAILCARRDDWFTPEAVGALTRLREDVRTKVPHVKSVLSILSVPLLRNTGGFIPNPTYLDREGVSLERAKKELLDHTQALGNLISRDGRDVSLLIYLEMPPAVERLEPAWSRAQGERVKAKLTGDRAGRDAAGARLAGMEREYDAALADLKVRRVAMVNGVRRVARDWSPRMSEPISLSGISVLNINLVEHVSADIVTFGVASFVLFMLALAAIYRRFRWTALPILTCLLPVVLIVGAMAMSGKKVTVITSNLPVLLFVLMLPYTVYFVERYRERRSLLPAETNARATTGAAREIWVPCLYSCTTTMAGFASLLTSGINPVRTFGLMMTIGMGVGLACAFLFLPSCSAPLRPLEGPAAGVAAGPRGVVRLLERAVLGAPAAILLLAAAVLGVSVWGATKLNVETKFIDYFWPSSEVYKGLETIDQRMGGTTPLEVMLTSKEPGHFKTEKGLQAIDAVQKFFGTPARNFEDGVPVTGNVRSLKTLLDEVRKSFRNMTGEQLSKIKIAEGQLREFVNADYTVTRVLVRFKETDPRLHRNNILRALEAHLERDVRPRGVAAKDTGVFRLYANMLNSLLKSQKDTFLMVVAAIYAMLLLLFRAPVLSLVVLVPQVLPALGCLGVMGWAGIPLDLVTVMIASIAMGVGIDAAIQYTVRYRIELGATGGDRRAAVTRSHATIGRAIWIATSIVVAGFVVLGLSKFVPTVTFGLFTALAMLMGQFAALTVLPALFLVLRVPR